MMENPPADTFFVPKIADSITRQLPATVKKKKKIHKFDKYTTKDVTQSNLKHLISFG